MFEGGAKGSSFKLPADFFPLEPHFSVPGFHFLPQSVRQPCFMSRLNLGCVEASSQLYHEALEESRNPSGCATYQELPIPIPQKCDIWTERFFWNVAKSYVAYSPTPSSEAGGNCVAPSGQEALALCS
jgi:hypothetical protein